MITESLILQKLLCNNISIQQDSLLDLGKAVSIVSTSHLDSEKLIERKFYFLNVVLKVRHDHSNQKSNIYKIFKYFLVSL
jgi:hypothetical protein